MESYIQEFNTAWCFIYNLMIKYLYMIYHLTLHFQNPDQCANQII